MALSGSPTSPWLPGALLATGQTLCFGLGSDVGPGGRPRTDSDLGEDGKFRAGAALSYTDNADGTISDNNTGLMWEKKSDDGTIHDQDTLYTWDNAFAVHIAGLNAGGGFAGHTDWRLPNFWAFGNCRASWTTRRRGSRCPRRSTRGV